ncbi:unnamed protein product, partial [Medioppia subpectinata]
MLYMPNLYAAGRINPCISIAEQLIASGHRALFVVNAEWSGRLTPYGIEEVLLAATDEPVGRAMNATETAKTLMAWGWVSGNSPLQKERLHRRSELWMTYPKYLDRQLDALLPDIQPDVIVLDTFGKVPAIELYGAPCVKSWGEAPLAMIDDDRAPPPCSGLSATGDQSLWQDRPGCEPLPEYTFHNHSRYLHIYGYPLELDYQDIRPLGRNYVRFDNLMRVERHLTFAVPPELAAKPGALVYFSMGTIASIDVQNMRRLVAILAKSPHRFIVSMGPLHKEYTLADNMWGAASVPQIRVLPLVDLVLTHGGNNTVSESLYFGRPMIAMPVFGDQYDNAQRIHDKGFGLRLDAYKCSEEELLAAIETLLNDKTMSERLAEVSRRIQSDN